MNTYRHMYTCMCMYVYVLECMCVRVCWSTCVCVCVCVYLRAVQPPICNNCNFWHTFAMCSSDASSCMWYTYTHLHVIYIYTFTCTRIYLCVLPHKPVCTRTHTLQGSKDAWKAFSCRFLSVKSHYLYGSFAENAPINKNKASSPPCSYMPHHTQVRTRMHTLYICIHIYVCIYMLTYMYIDIYAYVCSHVCMYVHSVHRHMYAIAWPCCYGMATASRID